jgi:phosphoribosylamine--glycine ligase
MVGRINSLRCLIIDSDRVGLDLAMRASAAGHEVKLFRYQSKPTNYATGFAPAFMLVNDWREHMAWAKSGLVLLTSNNRYVAELERYRDFGFEQTIFAPSVASAALEIERAAGMRLIESIGANLPPYQTFNTLDEVEAFALKTDKCWVFKPAGSEEDKSATYVSKDPADLVGWIRRKKKAGTKFKGELMLQERVERLCELGISGWMGPEGFLPDKLQLCWEHKPLLSGDIGPATGEMGSSTAYCETDPLFVDFLKPLETTLRALNHRGDTSVNCIIDNKGKAWFLEFTMRLGYPCFWLQIASHRGDPIQWMKDLLLGKDSLKVSYDPAAVVVMARPDFPYDERPPAASEGIPIRGAEAVLSDLHLVEAMMGTGPTMDGGKVVDGPTYQTAGTYVAVATALGKTVSKAREKVYKVVDQVSWPDRIYRDDIGCKVIKSLPALRKFGYATDVNP